jgi:lipoate-protein ligase A
MDGKDWAMVLLLVLSIAAALYGLHRAALWLEARGLLYYRKQRPVGGGAGVFGVLHEIYEPSIKQVITAKDEKRMRQREGIGAGEEERPIQLLELTLPTIAENLALDEALLLEAEAGRGVEVLRLWEWPTPAVIVGAGGRIAEDVDEAACQADGVPILRRSSGGGTVLLGSGCLLFSLVLAYDRSQMLREVRSSYCFILGRLRDALVDLLPEVTCAGTSDLAAAGLKFSGNSQQRKRDHLLHHGTLLYQFDLEAVGRYLRQPARQPEYRAGRVHEAFVRNLPCDAQGLRNGLVGVWRAAMETNHWPMDLVRQLVTKKYGTMEWNRRR